MVEEETIIQGTDNLKVYDEEAAAKSQPSPFKLSLAQLDIDDDTKGQLLEYL